MKSLDKSCINFSLTELNFHALTDCERYLGRDDPLTNSVRDNLQAVAE